MLALPLRLACAALAALLLAGCLLTPGKFTSTLSINADRSFAFTYSGEVYASDEAEAMSKGMAAAAKTPADPKATAEKKAAMEAKHRAMAETLAKEAGFRAVRYLGEGKFLIDYAMKGTLDHTFVWPFNTDAEIVLPFVAVELRGRDGVRVRAPGYANQGGSSQAMPIPDAAASRLDGTFTLDTDAEIVAQNTDEGPKPAGGRKLISWRATPLTKDAPSATLRVAPLK